MGRRKSHATGGHLGGRHGGHALGRDAQILWSVRVSQPQVGHAEVGRIEAERRSQVARVDSLRVRQEPYKTPKTRKNELLLKQCC